MTRYFKVLDANGRSCNGGDMQWRLPIGSEPGMWMPPIAGDLVPCHNGYHLCREQDLLQWLGASIWGAEIGEEIIVQNDKVVVRHVRLTKATHWNDRNARLFACWSAENVLHLYESKYPDDSRVRDCIETARQVANGDLPIAALAAARDAAREAARDAARDAAGDAAGDAARDAAWAAAGAAAGDAAWDAARDAARDAAWDAARDAQTKTLIHLLDTGELP